MTRHLILHVGTLVDDARQRLIATSGIRPFATPAIHLLAASVIHLRVVLATRLYVASVTHRRTVPATRPAEAATRRPAGIATRPVGPALPVHTITAIGPGVAACCYAAHLRRVLSHTIALHHVAAAIIVGTHPPAALPVRRPSAVARLLVEELVRTPALPTFSATLTSVRFRREAPGRPLRNWSGAHTGQARALCLLPLGPLRQPFLLPLGPSLRSLLQGSQGTALTLFALDSFALLLHQLALLALTTRSPIRLLPLAFLPRSHLS